MSLTQSVKIDVDLLAEVRKLAKYEGRTTAGQLRLLLRDALKRLKEARNVK